MSTFLRIVMLYRKGAPVEEITFVTRSSERLVKDYLKVYKTALEMPHRREKLEEELARVSARQKSPTDGYVVLPSVITYAIMMPTSVCLYRRRNGEKRMPTLPIIQMTEQGLLLPHQFFEGLGEIEQGV